MDLIALNRYVTVVKPALYRKLFPSKRAARLYCVLVWLVAILLATLPLYGWGKIVYHTKFNACTFSWQEKVIAYTIFFVGVFFNGVTITVLYSYFKIYKTVKESTKNMNAHGAENGVGTSTDSRRTDNTDIKLLVIRDSQVLAKLGVVTIFFIGWGQTARLQRVRQNTNRN